MSSAVAPLPLRGVRGAPSRARLSLCDMRSGGAASWNPPAPRAPPLRGVCGCACGCCHDDATAAAPPLRGLRGPPYLAAAATRRHSASAHATTWRTRRVEAARRWHTARAAQCSSVARPLLACLCCLLLLLQLAAWRSCAAASPANASFLLCCARALMVDAAAWSKSLSAAVVPLMSPCAKLPLLCVAMPAARRARRCAAAAAPSAPCAFTRTRATASLAVRDSGAGAVYVPFWLRSMRTDPPHASAPTLPLRIPGRNCAPVQSSPALCPVLPSVSPLPPLPRVAPLPFRRRSAPPLAAALPPVPGRICPTLLVRLSPAAPLLLHPVRLLPLCRSLGA